jgi:citronellol/citronellal dehydrogenase
MTACSGHGLFEGQVIVVTGGGSGIGRCIAHELAAVWARTPLWSPGGSRRSSTRSRLGIIAHDGGLVRDALAFDIRDEEAVAAAIAELAARHGRIHGLVNNAGGQFPADARRHLQERVGTR